MECVKDVPLPKVYIPLYRMYGIFSVSLLFGMLICSQLRTEHAASGATSQAYIGNHSL